ncbi:hypothetical protein ASG90_00770 [Nocardioides sp. Soil797]|nr:hypothetical protein ASG90_00770 [Nocardioides sp. Soil797]
MKLFAGLSTAALLVAGLTVASAPANAAGAAQADEYTPTINTFCMANGGKAESGKIRLKLNVVSNGAGSPKATVKIVIRNKKGKIVRTRTRSFNNGPRAYRFLNLKKGRYTVSFIVTPKGADADRYKGCTARIATKVKAKRPR